METIIKKAIEGGYTWQGDVRMNQWITDKYEGANEHELICDPLFWQALGKACGWNKDSYVSLPDKEPWEYYGLRFHEINLTEGWDHAVEWLSTQLKK